MEDFYTKPIEEVVKNSKIKLDVCDNETDMYWKVAIEVLEVIEENNKKGKTTFMIVPYGPIGPYFRMVHLINKYRVSLKNCVFVNMDEYLTDDKKFISKDDPLSFRGGMDRIFYSQIDEELNVLPENRYFPDSVTSIGSYAFSGCISLQYNEKDGLNYLGNENNKYLYLASVVSKDITTATIDNNCKFIGSDAFYKCSSLTSIVIPNSVTSIGDWAFEYCSSLTSIVIPDSVTSIGSYAFSGCSSLQFNQKDGLNYLGNENNKYLYLASVVSKDITTATIDNNCKFIGSYAFWNCESLTSITFNGTKNEWKSITKYYMWNYNVPATKVICSDGEVALG